jgi:putative endonuclease
MQRYYVYLVTNKKGGNIYAGSTDDLIRRVGEHKNKSIDGYAKNRGVHILVYYEEQDDIDKAITRERQIKKWNREWKIKLIEKSNPEWRDLYFDLIN